MDDLPAYRHLLAAVYQRHLSPAEMTRLRTFYLSPGGQTMIRAVFASSDLKPVIKDLYEDPDAKISAGSVDALQRQASDRARAAFDPTDTASLALLAKAAPLAKLQAVGVDLKKAMLDWVNKADPELDARIEALMTEAVERFLEKEAKE